MNEEFWRWYMYGHWVCLTQWLGFIMVEYAYLGKGRVKHPLVWSGVITMLTMTLSVVHNYGFFTPMAVALTLLFLFITVMLFGGTPGQKFTACLINGTNICHRYDDQTVCALDDLLQFTLQDPRYDIPHTVFNQQARRLSDHHSGGKYGGGRSCGLFGRQVAQAQCAGALAGADHELFSGCGRGAEHPAHAHR